MSSPMPPKPPVRRPISFFVAKPKEVETKEDKQLTLRSEAVMDRIFEDSSKRLSTPISHRSTNSNPLGIPEKTPTDDSFQYVKHKEPIYKINPKVIDYSKDLSDHESESGKST